MGGHQETENPPLPLSPATPNPPSPCSPAGRGGVALGGTVTVQCRGQHRNMRFLLYKDGNPNVLQDMEPAGDVAEFPIRNMSRRDAGSYSCRYSTKSDPPVWSEPSDPVELVVAGHLVGLVRTANRRCKRMAQAAMNRPKKFPCKLGMYRGCNQRSRDGTVARWVLA
ncbi:immunoglobulin superfamily member 1-like [Mauremys mutica]|uniref:immunoglobulin superfamily member 1-like n=1 Tax=Mauremys mutica TaxID=74926 RepID=UPI001D15EAC0|nr:immunoglobulin superfamily member 1-like [Mauremys mutica]